MGRSEEFGTGHGRPVYSGKGLAGGPWEGKQPWGTHALTERRTEEAKQEPGAKYDYSVAMVPTSSLLKYRELDRVGKHADTGSHKVIDNITEDLKAGKPMREPLNLEYDHSKNWAYLGEGHHRLEAAMRAGVSHVPLKVLRSRGAGDHKVDGRVVGAPLHMDTRLHEEHTGYYPSMIHPGNFQEFEGSR